MTGLSLLPGSDRRLLAFKANALLLSYNGNITHIQTKAKAFLFFSKQTHSMFFTLNKSA
jgi:hypothetical protein